MGTVFMTTATLAPSISAPDLLGRGGDQIWSRFIERISGSLSNSPDASSRTPRSRVEAEPTPRIGAALRRRPEYLDPAFKSTAKDFLELIATVAPQASPTAQIAVGEDSSIEATWLVCGDELSLSLSLDGSGYLLGITDRGEVMLDVEFSVENDPLSMDRIQHARRYLSSLGEKVAHRL